MRNLKTYNSILSCVRISATVISAALLLEGCLDQGGTGSESGTTVVDVPATVANPLTTPQQTICNPLNSPAGTTANNGVIANMVWLDSTMPPRNGQPALAHVADYFTIGNVVQSTLYFDHLYVPTRRFDLGFTTQAGQTVLNELGQPMYEYFALHFESQLQLGPNDPEGDYQMVLLSDDGSTLKVADGADPTVYRTLINDDGIHPTTMGCSNHTTTVPLHMTKTSKIPMMLDYFQGPRYHIALVVMWRPVPDGTDPNIPVDDPLCGTSGNYAFFNPDTGSSPEPNYYAIQARGWKVLQNNNYVFPTAASNPCVTPETQLTVSNFNVVNTDRVTVTVTWTTSIPSTSQVQYQNTATGATGTTTLDSTATMNHTVVISNLANNTIFSFTALSTSTDGQSVSSDPMAIRTLR